MPDWNVCLNRGIPLPSTAAISGNCSPQLLQNYYSSHTKLLSKLLAAIQFLDHKQIICSKVPIWYGPANYFYITALHNAKPSMPINEGRLFPYPNSMVVVTMGVQGQMTFLTFPNCPNLPLCCPHILNVFFILANDQKYYHGNQL